MLVTGLPDISAEFAKAIDTAALRMRICEVGPRLRLGTHIPFGVCRKQPFAARNPRTTCPAAPCPGPEPTGTRHVVGEDVHGARWWSMEQITASSEAFYPLSLLTVLPRFLAGESIEESLERWPLQG